MEMPIIPKMTTFGKWTVLILLAFILVWPLSMGLYWTVYKVYTIVDQTRFPELDQNLQTVLAKTSPDSPDPQKGAALAASIRNRLKQEMDSAFGWSVNDLVISPTRWLDNRGNRQRGTIFATRMLTMFFATTLAVMKHSAMPPRYRKPGRPIVIAAAASRLWSRVC